MLTPKPSSLLDLEINAGMRVYDSRQLCQQLEAVPHLHGASISQNIIDELINGEGGYVHT